ncbi:MAG TPA: hypothetical protein H9768_03975 [Candidatus Mailhella merdavium]|nr:hypothetical protein [Candidatus Mailhella merdavium]
MTQQNTDQGQEQKPDIPEPEAPRISFEDACALLKRHGRLVSEDDLELVVLVTLHNEFMRLTHKNLKEHRNLSEEQDKKHQAALKEIMNLSVEKMRKAIAAEKDAFSAAVRNVALENVTALISQHQKDMAEHRQTVRFCTFMCCACLGLIIFIFMRWL